MFALNETQVFARAKPKTHKAISLGAIVFALFSVEMLREKVELQSILCFLFFFPLAIFWIYRSFSPLSPYIPGKSFSAWRPGEKKIVLTYRLAALGGALVTVGLGIYIMKSGFNAALGKAAAGGLGLLAYGYYGLIAKRTHSDLDPVAANFALEAIPTGNDKIYLAYTDFDPGQRQSKSGDKVLLVSADRMFVCLYKDNRWQSELKPFSSIQNLGISSVKEGRIILYFGFSDGATFFISLSPFETITTEPISFVKSFLELLDSWAQPALTVRTSVAPRRVVGRNDAATSTVRSGLELEGQARALSNTNSAIVDALAAFTPHTRQLEL